MRVPFIERVLRGEAKVEDIDAEISAWHDTPEAELDRLSYRPNFADTGPDASPPLHEWLGLTEAEYGRFVENASALKDIVEERRKGRLMFGLMLKTPETWKHVWNCGEKFFALKALTIEGAHAEAQDIIRKETLIMSLREFDDPPPKPGYGENRIFTNALLVVVAADLRETAEHITKEKEAEERAHLRAAKEEQLVALQSRLTKKKE